MHNWQDNPQQHKVKISIVDSKIRTDSVRYVEDITICKMELVLRRIKILNALKEDLKEDAFHVTIQKNTILIIMAFVHPKMRDVLDIFFKMVCVQNVTQTIL